VPEFELNCPSADCKWDPYASLGICSKVVNITTDTADMAFIASLRHNATFGLQSFYNSTGYTEAVTSNFSATFNESLINTIIMSVTPSWTYSSAAAIAAIGEYVIAFSDTPVKSMDDIPNADFQFIDFIFYFCTKTFNSSVSSGTRHTSEMESDVPIAFSSIQTFNSVWNADYTAFYSPDAFCPPNILNTSMVLKSPPGLLSSENFTIDGCTGLGISTILLAAIPGAIVQLTNREGVAGFGELSYPVSRSIFGDFLQPPVNDSKERFQNIQTMIGNIAISLTNT